MWTQKPHWNGLMLARLLGEESASDRSNVKVLLWNLQVKKWLPHMAKYTEAGAGSCLQPLEFRRPEKIPESDMFDDLPLLLKPATCFANSKDAFLLFGGHRTCWFVPGTGQPLSERQVSAGEVDVKADPCGFLCWETWWIYVCISWNILILAHISLCVARPNLYLAGWASSKMRSRWLTAFE